MDDMESSGSESTGAVKSPRSPPSSAKKRNHAAADSPPTSTRKANAKKVSMSPKTVRAVKKGHLKHSPRKSDQAVPCLMPNCIEPRYRKLRWCLLHRRSCDAARDFSKSTDKFPDFQEAMKDDNTAVIFMTSWEKENPPGKRHTRKGKQFFDFATFEKKEGVRRAESSLRGKQKMTYRQFWAWGTYQQGLNDAEILEDWTSLTEGKAPVDHDGRKGKPRYMVNLDEIEYTKRETFTEGASIQGSEKIKNPKNEDLESLRWYAHTSADSNSNNAFLAGRWNAERGAAERASASAGGRAQDVDDESAAAEDLEAVQDDMDPNEKTAIFGTSEKQLVSLSDNMDSLLRQMVECMHSMPETYVALPMLLEDRAFQSYLDTMSVRVQAGMLWCGFVDSWSVVAPKRTMPQAILCDAPRDGSGVIGESREIDDGAGAPSKRPHSGAGDTPPGSDVGAVADAGSTAVAKPDAPDAGSTAAAEATADGSDAKRVRITGKAKAPVKSILVVAPGTAAQGGDSDGEREEEEEADDEEAHVEDAEKENAAAKEDQPVVDEVDKQEVEEHTGAQPATQTPRPSEEVSTEPEKSLGTMSPTTTSISSAAMSDVGRGDVHSAGVVADKVGDAVMNVIRMKHKSFEELFRAHPRKIPVTDTGNLKTRAQMQQELDELLDMEMKSAVDEFRQGWALRIACALALKIAMKKGHSCVKGHINKQQSKIANDKKRAQVAKEKDHIARTRAKAKASADRINSAQGQPKSSVPLSQVNFSALKPVEVVDKLDGKFPALDDKPMLFTNADKVEAWFSATSKALTDYAGQYKKSTDFKDEGRTQSPMTDAKAKSATEKLFQAMDIKMVDISGVGGGSTFQRRIWHWGYSDSLSMGQLMPQAAAMVRIVAGGELECWMAPCAALLSSLDPDMGMSMDQLVERFGNLDVSAIEKMRASGECDIHHVKVIPASSIPALLFIPQGWLVFEQACPSGGPLLYCIRKSFFQGTQVAAENFRAAGKLIANSGNGTSKHSEIAKLVDEVAKAQRDQSGAAEAAS